MAWPHLQQLLHHPRFGVRRGEMKQLTVKGADGRRIGLTQPQRPLDHRIEHRLKVAGRGIDYAQNL